MKRYYPILVAVILASGVLWYALSGKGSTISARSISKPSNSLSDSSSNSSLKASSLSDGVHTGKVVATDYGDIQVAITVSKGKITDVTVLKQPGSEQRSVDINTNAIPKLKSEVLTAQSSTVDAVSGASFTSEGFVKTLQSAFTS